MFKITIEEVNEVQKTVREYNRIGEKEVEREERFITPESPEKTVIIAEWGYLPEEVKTITERRTVLVQEVDTLDIPSVIKAINGL